AHVGSDRASRLVPFVSLAAVELVLVLRALSAEGPAARVLLLGTGLLLALVVVRQIVALRENSALIRARLKEQDRYALLVRNSSDAAILVSPEGMIRSEVPALARVLGAMSRSFEGESIFGFLDAADRTRLRTYFSELAPGHTARPIVVRLAGSPEEERYVEVVAADHRLDPLVGGIVLNLRDASERVGLETQLREAHKMEGIGRLAGGIAHDFNNLLTAILGNCELIEMEPQGSDAIKEEVGEVRRAAERAADLTRQLLQFARREMVAPQVLDIQEALWATERLLRRVLSEHIELSITCRGGPLRIKADATQLHQVVLNLVVNARDAMPDGGRLTISGAPREVSAHGSGSVKGLPGGSYVELRVSDTGLGMPPDVLRRIFEPFFTTKSVGAGTGLGLATTYGIVRQLGGSIVAESRMGEGSIFTLLLPTTEEEAESADEPSFPGDARGRGTVLLAEDEPAVRALAARALVERGFEVLLAVDGEDALRVVESYGGSIEYVVSDLVMRRMGGVALANALRELGHRPRVLFMTGYTDVDIAALSDGADAEGVLLKPFAPSALLGELDRLGWTRETANDGYETARVTSSRSP
ncbi:MAG: ATP-binding protein, partial [Gemmatimonadaceae bacterium]